ncbi:UNVERIFIED_CONTAM: hypothetical protein RMT77_006848 [Armadillidium vulgare]
MKVQGKYWYILAQMFFDENALPYDLTPSHLEVVFKSPLCSIFGETVSTLPFSVLKYDKDSKTAIIKVSKEIYVQARAALTLLTAMTIGGKDIPVVVSVVTASPQLLSLSSPINRVRVVPDL